jgi:transcriptional regulator with XRE-family HTH domain
MLVSASPMEDWRTRLIQAVDADGRSDRAISEAAGLGVNFVNELRRGEKEPGVNKVLKLAGTLRLSLGFVFNGAEISARDEADLKLFLSLSPASRQAILDLARQLIATERA